MEMLAIPFAPTGPTDPAASGAAAAKVGGAYYHLRPSCVLFLPSRLLLWVGQERGEGGESEKGGA